MSFLDRINFDMQVATLGNNNSYQYRVDQVNFAAIQQQIRNQWTSNALQEQANQIALANHQLLYQIDDSLGNLLHEQERVSNILEEIQRSQQQHMAQIKRERSLKEVLFQIEKYLEQTKTIDDRISAGYTAERLLAVIDQNRFSTEDLGEIADKRFFDAILNQTKEILRNMAPDEVQELEQFRDLYAAFHLRTKDGPPPTHTIGELIDRPVWNEVLLDAEPEWSDVPIPPKPSPLEHPAGEPPALHWDEPLILQHETKPIYLEQANALIKEFHSKEVRQANADVIRELQSTWLAAVVTVTLIVIFVLIGPTLNRNTSDKEKSALSTAVIYCTVIALVAVRLIVTTLLQSLSLNWTTEIKVESKEPQRPRTLGLDKPQTILGIIGYGLLDTLLGIVGALLSIALCGVGVLIPIGILIKGGIKLWRNVSHLIMLQRNGGIVWKVKDYKRYLDEVAAWEHEVEVQSEKNLQRKAEFEKNRLERIVALKKSDLERREAFEKELKRVDAHNDSVRADRERTVKQYKNALSTMAQMIGSYLDEHPPLQRFFTKV